MALPGGRYVEARTLLGAAPTALGIVLLAYPALAGWANFWRAYGAARRAVEAGGERPATESSGAKAHLVAWLNVGAEAPTPKEREKK